MRLKPLDRTALPIFAAAGVLALCLWIAIAAVLQSAERETLAKANTEGRNLANSMAEHLASSVRAIDLVLEHLRDNWVASTLPFAEQVALQKVRLAGEGVSQVIVTDAKGRIAYSSLPGFRGVDVSDWPFFKAHHELGESELSIGAPLLGPDLKQLTIKFTRPIYDRQGHFAGVLALLIPPLKLARIHDDIELGEDAIITLVRSDGQILSRSHDMPQASSVSLADTAGLARDDPPAGGYTRTAKTDGVERLYRYQKVSGYPLTVYVGQAMETVLAPYRAQRARYAIGGGLATVLLFAVALLLALRIGEREEALRSRDRLEAKLRQSEERLRLIAENIDEVIWSIDLAGGNTLYASPAYDRVWGRPRQRLMNQPGFFFDSIHPKDVERISAAYRFDRLNRPFNHEYRIILPDGSLRWIWDRGYPVYDDGGRIVRYVGAAQDITKRKRAEQALQDQMAHLQLVYDTSSAAIFDADPLGTIIHANRRMAEMFGLPLKELIGSRYVELLHPDEREPGEAGMTALMQGQTEVLDRERHYQGRDGNGFWGRITARRMVDAEGKLIGLVGVIVDISAARQAVEALKRNEARLREVLDAFPIAVGYVDKAERVTFANRLYRETFGQDYRGRTVREYAGEQAYAVLQPYIRRALSGETVQIERALVDRAGQLNVGLLRYFPDRDAEGKVAGYFVFREDITARRRAEEQIRSLNEDLERRVRERTAELSAANAALQEEVRVRRQAETEALDLAQRLQSMARRLGEAQEIERRRLAAELHDGVGSHLAAIGLNLSLLQKQLSHGELDGMPRKLADMIALLDQAKANAKEISVDLRPLLLEDRDLFPALEEYARKFEDRTGIAVRVKGARSRRRLPAEKKVALFRIAQEALTNCAKHAHANTVSIEFDNRADLLLLSVVDDGIGVDLAGVNSAGAGLGLLSMQERAEAIGGRWRIESAPGKGTRVSVSVGTARS